ncbi:MAG: hypothetical protein J5710_04695 [Treponema sp.]|nr:hypothetical protein [Treponema sp.]
MKKSIIIISAIILTTLFTSCASKEKPPRERDETFVADIGQFEIGTIHLYASYGMTQPRICDFNAVFYPRNNYIYFTTKIGIDKIELCFSYPERKNLSQAKDKYLELYTEGQIPNEKPKKKNALSTGNAYINWGTLGPSHQAYASYYTNIEYILDNKPYFRILFEQTKELDDSGNSSPRINIYISPAQWEQICEMCDQATLEAQVDEILEEAEAF